MFFSFNFILFYFLVWIKSVYCDYLLISDVIIKHEIKLTKTLISVVLTLFCFRQFYKMHCSVISGLISAATE